MKSLKTALLAVAMLSLYSCSSEYNQRLMEAKVLKEKLNRTIENKENLGFFAQEEISELNEQIKFHAKLSGNEELFIQELNSKD